MPCGGAHGVVVAVVVGAFVPDAVVTAPAEDDEVLAVVGAGGGAAGAGVTLGVGTGTDRET